MKKFTLFIIFLFCFGSIYAQVVSQEQDEIYRPKHKSFGFNISMGLSSKSEQLQALYLEQNSGLFNGLDLSFRYYLSNKIAYRTNISFLNSKEKYDLGFNNIALEGLSELTWTNGIMLVLGGTDKLEPYGFLDAGLGWIHSRENVGGNEIDIKRTLLFRKTSLTTGLGFNYYFAKNIGFGAELGTGLNVLTFPVENKRVGQMTQFLSGIGGKMGVTIIF